MRLYEKGTEVPWSDSDFNYWNPQAALPSGAYLGQTVFSSYDEEYRVCKAGAKITVGNTPVLTAAQNQTTQAITAAQLVDTGSGENRIKVTLTLTDDDWAGGLLVIDTGAGNEGIYRVAGNGTDYIDLIDDIPVAFDSTASGYLIKNTFVDVRIAGADNLKAAGAATVSVTSGYYFLAKKKGIELMTVEAIAATSGQLTKAASGALNDGTLELIGAPVNENGAISAGDCLVVLNVA